jgi:acyl-CoA synthetase (AMP-forming)/AMP-acid ligase II
MGRAASEDLARSALSALVERWASDAPAATYLCAARDDESVTFAELGRVAASWRALARDEGLGDGARVGLSIGDPLAFSSAFLGAIAAGLWVVPFDPSLESNSPEAFVERARRVRVTRYLSDADTADVSWREVEGSDVPVAGATGGGVVMASSGTTGAPKVMRLGVDQLLTTAHLVATHNRLTASDKGFNPLPLFHINAQVVGLLATLSVGASLTLDDRFHRTDFWNTIERHETTWINAVPAIIARLVPLRDGERVASTLRFVRSASAPLPASLLTSFESATGLPLVESYGMTEAASQICANPLEGPHKVGSVGLPVGVRLRVRSDADSPCAVGTVGHVEITGLSVIGQYESPGYEDRFTDDGWLRTGDNGYLDEDGYVFLVGRSDDVINRGGEKIFPREIEEVLVRLPDVQQAAVIGLPDEVFGQVPVAYVQLRDVDATTPIETVLPIVKELREALVAAFARSRRPAALHVVEALPAGATGKVQKGALRTSPPATLVSENVG